MDSIEPAVDAFNPIPVAVRMSEERSVAGFELALSALLGIVQADKAFAALR